MNSGSMSKRNKKGRDIDGVLILDKASGQSSNSALQEIKRYLEPIRQDTLEVLIH